MALQTQVRDWRHWEHQLIAALDKLNRVDPYSTEYEVADSLETEAYNELMADNHYPKSKLRRLLWAHTRRIER